MWKSIRARRRRKAEGWDVERRWKEEVVYWEGEHGFVLDGAWGVTPLMTFVHDAATWDEATPEWLHGRRDEVVARLERAPFHHLVVEEDARHWGDPGRRVVTRS